MSVAVEPTVVARLECRVVLFGEGGKLMRQIRTLMMAIALTAVLPLGIGAARAEEVPERIVLVDKLMAMLSLDQAMSQVAAATTQTIVARVRRANPGMTDANANAVYKLFYDAMMGMTDESITLSRASLLKYYTKEDLKVMIAFYETPTGRKSIELMPQIIQEVTLETQGMLERRLPPLVEALNKRLKDAGYNLPG